MRVLAGIVTYNPDIGRLTSSIYELLEQVDEIVIFDNNSKNIKLILDFVNHFAKTVSVICNKDNLGVANAFNHILMFGKEKNYKWVLILDQDSVVSPQLISRYTTYLEKCVDPNIALLTCNIIDRNIKNIHTICNNSKEIDIDYCISSGTFNNISILENIGLYDEKMFIDKVDTEICMRIKKKGYRIVRLNYNGLLHEIGSARRVKILFRQWDMYNHSYIRRFYACRNSIYLLKKYRNVKALKEVLGEIFRSFLILLYEIDRIKKTFYAFKGFFMGYLFNLSFGGRE